MDVPRRRLDGVPCPTHPRPRAEQGRIMVLLAGLLSVLLALVLVIAGATSLHLERKRLLALTDAAATYAASSLDAHAYFTGVRPEGGMPISDRAVRDAVAEYLAAEVPAERKGLADVRIDRPTGAPDAATATVTLRARLQPAILPAELWRYLDGVEVEVTSSARAGSW